MVKERKEEDLEIKKEPCTPERGTRQPMVQNGRAPTILDDEDSKQSVAIPLQDPATPDGRYFLRSGNTSARRRKIGLRNSTTPSNAVGGPPAPILTMARTQQLSAQLAGVTSRRSTTAAAAKELGLAMSDPSSIVDEIVMLKAAEWHLRARRARSPAECLDRSFVTPKNELVIYDGFRTTWFIPVDTDLPCPPEKAHEQTRLYQRRAQIRSYLDHPSCSQVTRDMWRLLEKEAEEECADDWDGTVNAPLATTAKRWIDVRKTLTGTQLIDMITRKRLREFQVLLPGYFMINIVYMTAEGQFTMMEQHIPYDIGLDAFLPRLDMWDPPGSLHNEQVISIARFKTATLLDSAQGSSGELRKDTKRVCTHLFRP